VAPDQRPAEAWEATVLGSPAATVLDAACRGAFPGEAYALARAPLAEAQRVFAANAAARVASASQGAAPSPGPSAPKPGGLMARDALVQCLNGSPPPDTPACRVARASADRGRAARPAPPRGSAPAAGAGQQSYAQFLDSIVRDDSQDWGYNMYIPGSMEIDDVQRDAQGNVSMLRGNYRYGVNPATISRLRGTIFDPSPWGGGRAPLNGSPGWVEVHFVNGRFECMRYHDRSDCITSTRDSRQQGNDAAREHYEYCQITRNC
jgi:hypothetical protein